MALVDTVSPPVTASRFAYADNLKVVLVAGVIVAHVTLAWTGIGTWVFEEPHVGEPMLSVLTLTTVVVAMFGIPLFFLIAGMFTPRSLRRKGLLRFMSDRFLRLGVPMVFYVVFLSPIIEYVDPDNAGWDRGFGPFLLHIWWPPAPGPTWFLGVLLVFSIVYAVARSVLPMRVDGGRPLRFWELATAAATITIVSYLVRFAVPLGSERWRLALGQAPAWVVGFAIGVIGAERGVLPRIDSRLARGARRWAWSSVTVCIVFFGSAAALGSDIDDFAGGGTWQSLLTAALEGIVVVSVSLWLIDLFRRRFDHQRRLWREMSRAAFAAFVLHQLVLVALVLATRRVSLPPEADYLATATLGVVASFALGAAVIRVPGVSRVM